MIDFGAAVQPQGKTRKKAALAKTNPFDLAPVKAKLAVYSEAIDKMVALAEKHEVKDDASNQGAVALGTQAKKLNNQIEDLRKQIVAGPNEFVKAVNSLAKAFQERLKIVENDLKKKISDRQYKLELERREKERKAREEAERLQKKLDEEAKEKGIESVKVVAPVMPAPAKVTRTETGQSHQRMEWTFEIQDEAKVPREYLAVNEQKIRQAVKMGVREIPGVRIFEKASTVFRT